MFLRETCFYCGGHGHNIRWCLKKKTLIYLCKIRIIRTKHKSGLSACFLNPFGAGTEFTSESDVYRRQILTSKFDPRTEMEKYL